MKTLLMLATILAVAACGVETAGTAATAAALKKQEMEQGRKTAEQLQQQLDQANRQSLQRAEEAGGRQQ